MVTASLDSSSPHADCGSCNSVGYRQTLLYSKGRRQETIMCTLLPPISMLVGIRDASMKVLNIRKEGLQEKKLTQH